MGLIGARSNWTPLDSNMKLPTVELDEVSNATEDEELRIKKNIRDLLGGCCILH